MTNWLPSGWKIALPSGIRGRLYLLVGLFAIGCAALAAALIWLQSQRAYQARMHTLEQLVTAATGVLAAHKDLADSGQMPVDQAKQRALSVLRKMWYGPNDYFVVRERSGVSLLNPSRPEREGKSQDDVPDSHGFFFSRELTNLIQGPAGEGFVTFYTLKPDTKQDAQKTSFITLYKPWDWGVTTGVFTDDLAAETHAAMLEAALITLVLVGLLGGIAIWQARAIVGPLGRLRVAMAELAEGRDISEPLDTERKDEIGAMAKTVQVFRDNAAALKTAQAEAAEQQRAAAAARERSDEARKRDEEARAQVSKQVADVVEALGAGLDRLAEGDLTCNLEAKFAPEYQKVQNDFNAAVDRLRQTVGAIAASTREVSSAAAEISTSTTDLSQRTKEQAASIEETSASMEQMSATVRKNAENAQQANDLTKATCSVADRGGKVVTEAVEAMARIEDSSRKIADIIGVIDEIARQTNLLALNAAVEAARAGDAGRGFAVVASEVRSLAQRSAQAAKEIKDLINNSSGHVRTGVELVNRAGASLTEIVESVNRVAAIVGDIANASNEQATGLDQINKALTQLDEVTQQNSALVEENAATAKTLESQSAAMGERVDFFRLDERAAAARAA
jgi:methyl-accepting chemotaxis protein